jgi:hypothetical protein
VTALGVAVLQPPWMPHGLIENEAEFYLQSGFPTFIFNWLPFLNGWAHFLRLFKLFPILTDFVA